MITLVVIVVVGAVLLFRAPAAEPTDAAPPGEPLVRAAPRRLTEPVAEPLRDAAPPAERLPAPALPEEDLWAMVPDEHRLRELQEEEFVRNGGIDTPGTDPEGARREVDEPGWAERTEAEIRRGLEERVLVPGMAIRALDCERGRCLVELTYRGMDQAVERTTALRAWAEEALRCRAYSDGPSDEESPYLADNQQIWILCGRPSEE